MYEQRPFFLTNIFDEEYYLHLAVYFNEHELPAAAWNAIPCSDDRSKPEYKTLDVKGNEASSVFFTNFSPEIFTSSVYTTARNGKGYNAYMGPAVFIHEQPQGIEIYFNYN